MKSKPSQTVTQVEGLFFFLHIKPVTGVKNKQLSVF